jgi:hypothetical protein
MSQLPAPANHRPSISVAVVVGVGYLLVMYLLARHGGYELAADTPQQQLLYLVWIGLGQLLLAGLPVYLLVEYGYLLPTVVFLGIAGYAVGVELGGSADSSLAIYGMFWVVPMAVVLLAVGIEYAVRSTVLG